MSFTRGDWVTVTEMADGSLQLRRTDPVFEKGIEIAEKATKTYRNALAELAK